MNEMFSYVYETLWLDYRRQIIAPAADCMHSVRCKRACLADCYNIQQAACNSITLNGVGGNCVEMHKLRMVFMERSFSAHVSDAQVSNIIQNDVFTNTRSYIVVVTVVCIHVFQF